MHMSIHPCIHILESYILSGLPDREMREDKTMHTAYQITKCHLRPVPIQPKQLHKFDSFALNLGPGIGHRPTAS